MVRTPGHAAAGGGRRAGVWAAGAPAMGEGTDPASSARGSRGDLAAFASACPCAFAIVLRRCSALEDFTREAVVKALGKPLAEWIFSGKPTDSWFGVFGACVGSEWGYLKTMEAYATKSVEGTSLASFRKQSAYINKNKQLRPQTSHVRAPVATPPRRS